MHQTKIIKQLQNVAPALKQKYPIASIAVFGSALRDDFDRENSDVDILVDYRGSDVSLYLQFADELESILNRKIDIVTLRSLKERHWNYLKEKIFYV